MIMKASKLRDGLYFAAVLRINDGNYSGVMRDKIISITGNQIQYFGTEYFDDAKKATGVFHKLTPESIKSKHKIITK